MFFDCLFFVRTFTHITLPRDNHRKGCFKQETWAQRNSAACLRSHGKIDLLQISNSGLSALKLMLYSLSLPDPEKEVATNQCLLIASLNSFSNFVLPHTQNVNIHHWYLIKFCYLNANGQRAIDGLCVLVLILLQVCLGASQTQFFWGAQLDERICLAKPTPLFACKCHSQGNTSLVFCLFKILLLVYKAIFI